MIFDQFEKVKKSWPHSKKSIPYGDLTKKALFELAYHSSNDVPFRCIHVITKSGDEPGNEAVIYSSLEKIFTSITGTDNNVDLVIYCEDEDAGIDKLNNIIVKLNKFIIQFKKRSDNLKDQITKSILVERKIDKAVNLAMNKDISRKIYFAIGETRERGALIPLIMNSKGADVVQLAIMKWMNSALNVPQDDNFPEKKVKGLVKNFLQIKDWLLKLINKSFTAPEDELLKKEEEIVENES